MASKTVAIPSNHTSERKEFSLAPHHPKFKLNSPFSLLLCFHICLFLCLLQKDHCVWLPLLCGSFKETGKKKTGEVGTNTNNKKSGLCGLLLVQWLSSPSKLFLFLRWNSVCYCFCHHGTDCPVGPYNTEGEDLLSVIIAPAGTLFSSVPNALESEVKKMRTPLFCFAVSLYISLYIFSFSDWKQSSTTAT